MEQLVDKAGLSADENDQPWMTSLYSTSPGMGHLYTLNRDSDSASVSLSANE